MLTLTSIFLFIIFFNHESSSLVVPEAALRRMCKMAFVMRETGLNDAQLMDRLDKQVKEVIDSEKMNLGLRSLIQEPVTLKDRKLLRDYASIFMSNDKCLGGNYFENPTGSVKASTSICQSPEDKDPSGALIYTTVAMDEPLLTPHPASYKYIPEYPKTKEDLNYTLPEGQELNLVYKRDVQSQMSRRPDHKPNTGYQPSISLPTQPFPTGSKNFTNPGTNQTSDDDIDFNDDDDFRDDSEEEEEDDEDWEDDYDSDDHLAQFEKAWKFCDTFKVPTFMDTRNLRQWNDTIASILLQHKKLADPIYEPEDDIEETDMESEEREWIEDEIDDFLEEEDERREEEEEAKEDKLEKEQELLEAAKNATLNASKNATLNSMKDPNPPPQQPIPFKPNGNFNNGKNKERPKKKPSSMHNRK
ncbi:uncharacterized protein LOC141857033 [Brevipalpus obovatus]|uniref:uncharacterized protein LOC141857033 n=1 Tax=Brevipalpus obovatus TaxID=246614 RepID=UPI003D9E5D10